jgi:hypothetical protein
MKMALRRKAERVSGKLPQVTGKSDWKHAARFDHSRIAERGLLTRSSAIDQRGRDPSLREMRGDGHADHAGTKDQDVAAWHGFLFSRFLVSTILRAG